ASPCHIGVDPDSRHVYVANYAAGSVVVFPVLEDGSLGAVTDHFRHSGSGPKSDRQSGPHTHCVIADPSGRYLVALDLGLDKLMVYRKNEQGALVPNQTPFFQ